MPPPPAIRRHRRLDLNPQGSAGEIRAKRGARSKHFRLRDGRERIICALRPLHYRDDSGRWAEPNPVLRRGQISAAHYRLQLLPGVAGWSYRSRSGGAATIRLDSIAGRKLGRVGPPEIDGELAHWTDLAPGLSLTLQCLPAKIRSYITLADAAAPRSWEWAIAADTDLAARIADNARGWDAEGRRNRLELSTVETPGGLTGKRTLYRQRVTWTGRVSRIANRRTRQRRWFDDPQYPVTIDPDITEDIAAEADDGWVSDDEFNEGNILWGWEYGTGAYPVWRFQGVAVDQGASISLAELKIYVNDSYNGYDDQPGVYGVDIDDCPAWGSSNAPYYYSFVPVLFQPYGRWTTANSGTVAIDSSGAKTVDVTSVVQEIVDRAGWASGNDLGLFGVSADSMHINYLDDYGDSNPATLEITLTGGGGGSPADPSLMLGAVL